MALTYNLLGKYIHQVDERNKDLITDSVLGINIDKFFMPSVANVIGTDLSNYKLLRKNRFACNPMHVGRDSRLPVSLYQEDTPAIVSPAYFMFEINDISELDPEYLMLCFRRPLFDRFCTFKTDASVRGGISWEDLCSIDIPMPSTIEEQRKIVHDYKVITDRIELLKELNEKNLSYAQTIYKKFISDKANNTKLLDIVNINEKSKIQVSEADNGNYPFFTSGLSILNDSHKMVEGKNLFISTGGKFFVQFFDGDASYSTDTLSICGKKDLTIYIYLWLLSKFNYIAETCFHGSALEHLQKDEFFGLELYAPTDEEISYFNHQIVPFFDFITNSNKEINNLLKLKKVFISNLGKGE